MEALKKKVDKMMFDQNHILNAVKYLNERLEDIEKKKCDKADMKEILESQTMVVKNTDEIKMLITTKQENDALITILDKKIGKFNDEI